MRGGARAAAGLTGQIARAVCRRVLPCAAMCRHVLPCAAMCRHVLPCAAMCRHVLPCAAMCCHVLPCAAMCCHVLPCAVTRRVPLAALFAPCPPSPPAFPAQPPLGAHLRCHTVQRSGGFGRAERDLAAGAGLAAMRFVRLLPQGPAGSGRSVLGANGVVPAALPTPGAAQHLDGGAAAPHCAPRRPSAPRPRTALRQLSSVPAAPPGSRGALVAVAVAVGSGRARGSRRPVAQEFLQLPRGQSGGDEGAIDGGVRRGAADVTRGQRGAQRLGRVRGLGTGRRRRSAALDGRAAGLRRGAAAPGIPGVRRVRPGRASRSGVGGAAAAAAPGGRRRRRDSCGGRPGGGGGSERRGRRVGDVATGRPAGVAAVGTRRWGASRCGGSLRWDTALGAPRRAAVLGTCWGHCNGDSAIGTVQ